MDLWRVIARLFAAMLSLSGAAAAAEPSVRLVVAMPAPPTTPMPADLYAELLALTYPDDGCTHTRIGPTTVTATHCLDHDHEHDRDHDHSRDHEHGSWWATDGDIAFRGPPVAWVDPVTIPRGATVYAVGYPRKMPGPVPFALSTLGEHTVVVAGRQQLTLMAVGDGTPCTGGSSGMVAWVTINGEMRPVGTMSVYSVDPAVTGLPAGQYVCGFAI